MADSDGQEAIYAEFEERSLRRWWMLIPMVSGALVTVAWPGDLLAVVFGNLLMMAGLIGLYLIYRCPACDQSMIKQVAVYCPRCGVRLKRPE